jgi:hypothetical protein
MKQCDVYLIIFHIYGASIIDIKPLKFAIAVVCAVLFLVTINREDKLAKDER